MKCADHCFNVLIGILLIGCSAEQKYQVPAPGSGEQTMPGTTYEPIRSISTVAAHEVVFEEWGDTIVLDHLVVAYGSHTDTIRNLFVAGPSLQAIQ